MHAVIRRYRVRLGTMEQAARYAEKWFLPLVRQIPGFKAFYLMASGESVLASLGLFETPEGAQAAGNLGREWFGEEWGSFRALPPEMITGEILAEVSEHNRATQDRRQQVERRRGTAFIGTEKRSGLDRRAGGDRRGQSTTLPLLEWRAAG
jgi:hypothetical protein